MWYLPGVPVSLSLEMVGCYFPEDMKPLIEHATTYTPLGRIGLPEDMANAVWLLTQKEAAWITGQTIVVDGGLSLL